MVGSAFTTKKMKLEKKDWLRKSMLGTAIIAVLSGVAFGAYHLITNDPTSQSDRSRYTSTASPKRQGSSAALPKFASSGNSGLRHAIHGKNKPKSSTKTPKAAKKSTVKKLTHQGKHKSQKWAKHHKNKSQKLAKHKKQTKHHIAHNKRYQKQNHLTAQRKHTKHPRHLAAD
jgi:hypothetical protein